MIDAKQLDTVIQKTIQAVENSKEEIYHIGETAQQDYQRIKRELVALQEDIAHLIPQVDQAEKLFQQAKMQLMIVHRDFNKYSETQIKDAYDAAHNKQIELLGLREKEKLLRLQRDHMERNLKSLEQTLRRTEELISNMGMALKFLTNDLEALSAQIGDIQKMQGLGLSIIRAQEEERKRVAREIHDGPAQSMANIVMRAEFCIKLLEKNPPKVQQELFSLIDLVRSSLQDVRKIIFDLRPMVLDDLGLIPALKRYTEQYNEDYGIYVELIVFGRERRFDSSLEVALFRVIQESLANIKKHAKAKQVVIKIEFVTDKVNVVIRDNGCGFDIEQVLAEKNQKGFGLLGMRERIQLIKGKITIKSTTGQGTEICLSVPCSQQ